MAVLRKAENGSLPFSQALPAALPDAGRYPLLSGSASFIFNSPVATLFIKVLAL
jgi:hypothetical protein